MVFMPIPDLTSKIRLHAVRVSLQDIIRQPRLVRKQLEVPLKTNLPEGLVIGRDSQKASLVIEDIHISRTHAAILYEQGQFYLQDLGSKNGTFLNEQKLDRGSRSPQALQDGDKLRFNIVEFEFVVPEEEITPLSLIHD